MSKVGRPKLTELDRIWNEIRDSLTRSAMGYMTIPLAKEFQVRAVEAMSPHVRKLVDYELRTPHKTDALDTELEKLIGENMGCYYRVKTDQWLREVNDPQTKEYRWLTDVTLEVRGTVKAIKAHYLSREAVREAIGEDENEPLMCYECQNWSEGRNELRKSFKQVLGLDEALQTNNKEKKQ